MCTDNAWSEEFREVLACGKEVADKIGVQEVSASCLLLGMMKINCRATAILRHLGLNIDSKYDEWITQVQQSDKKKDETISNINNTNPAAPVLDSACLRIVRIASLEARKMRDDTTRTEHLLLGILRADGNPACDRELEHSPFYKEWIRLCRRRSRQCASQRRQAEICDTARSVRQ